MINMMSCFEFYSVVNTYDLSKYTELRYYSIIKNFITLSYNDIVVLLKFSVLQSPKSCHGNMVAICHYMQVFKIC